MGRKCCYKSCKLDRKGGDRRTFVFRRHDYKIWADLCGIDIKHMKINNILTNLVVCDAHFEAMDYVMKYSPFKRTSRLSKEAVPKGEILSGKVLI